MLATSGEFRVSQNWNRLVLEVTGQRRSRLFRYEPYVCLFDEPGDTADEPASAAVTEGPFKGVVVRSNLR